jgi:DNA repair protein RadA/Sms
MPRLRSRFVCGSCGFATARPLGRCPQCSEWGALVEEAVAAAAGGGGGDGAEPVPLVEVHGAEVPRRASGIGELDRVLGGGLVRGSLVLLGGDPGIGKSTLLMQGMSGLARAGPVLYASGEESCEQVAMRGRRLGVTAPGLLVLAETRLERILEHAAAVGATVVAVDSVQTVHLPDAAGLPGSLAQVREAAGRLLAFAKGTGRAVVLVGHVTKDGALAGPKTLEHLVDVVLQFEGERDSGCRVLRAQKNRFGSTAEIGVFEMAAEGLREVPNPSALFLAERPVGAPGSAVAATLEGARPLLVEVQALVAAAAGPPRRTALGLDPYRVALLLAVLERRAGVRVVDQDVFVNVAGGFRLDEPAADLGLAAAVASAARGAALEPTTACFGELGLAGEVRAVRGPELRLAEAARLGFRRCVVPEASRARLGSAPPLEVVGVRDLPTALRALLDRERGRSPLGSASPTALGPHSPARRPED